MSGNPVQQYVPPYSHGEGPPERRGPSPIVIVVIVIAVVLVVGLIAIMVFIASIGNIAGDPWEDTRSFDTEVHIQDGGHFRYLVSDSWEDELIINLSLRQLNGTEYDVYIMNEDQYENAYGNESTGAFSALQQWQKVSTFTDSVTFDRPSGNVYLVIDNVDMPQVPDNAVPTGSVHVDLALEMTSRYDAAW